jgi:hypothetical protein
VSDPYLLGLVGAAFVLLLVLELLRRRHLRGKYAVLWLVLSVVISVFAVAPGLLDELAQLLGVQLPVNLLFFGGTLLLLAVIMQLSYESGRLEEETRTLAEEVALLRFDLERLREASHEPGSTA